MHDDVGSADGNYSTTKVLRYARSALFWDALGGLAGGAVCAAIALQVPVGWYPCGLFALLAVLFTAYGGLTLLRSRMRIAITAEQITWEPRGGSFGWDELTQFELAYFSTRRDRESGWMQLTLTASSGERLRVDSRIESFDQLVRTARTQAARAGLELSAPTLHNLSALGLLEQDGRK
jgi:hypothetical protein